MKKLTLFLILFTFIIGLLILVPNKSEACCGWPSPPVISKITADPDTLWPPNHKMVEISLEVVGTNIQGWRISSVEVQNIGPGEGDPTNDPDYKIGPPPFQTLSLRAERSGKAGARLYVVNITAINCTERGCITTTAPVTITVPHDMRK